MVYPIITALCLGTGAIALLAWLLWKKTREPGFMLGIFFLYFWSLHGAWRILVNYCTKGQGDCALFERLFYVELDSTYLKTVIFYALFIVAVELVLLLLVKPKRNAAIDISKRVDLDPYPLLLLGGVSLAICNFMLRVPRKMASEFGTSIYIVIARMSYESKVAFTLHQVLLGFALFSTTLGISLYASGKDAKYLVIHGRRPVFFLLGALLVALYFYVMSLGDRGALVGAFVPGLLVYLLNARKPKWSAIAFLLVFLPSIIGVLSVIRSRMYTDLFGSLTFRDFLTGLNNAFLNNNENFAAHFSLYGVFKYEVPVCFGASVVSLAASFVPRIFWPDRPQTIYDHYAHHVGASSDQGFSMHHAAGWYLNFGLTGIFLGAVLMAWVWAELYNLSQRGYNGKNRALRVYSRIAVCVFVGCLPMFIRAGIEGYKGVIIGVALIPIITLFFATTKFKI